MGKASKLYQRLREAPSRPVAFRDFEQCIKSFGFEHWRSRGSHRSYKHPEVDEILTIQPKGKDAQPYQVRLFLAMVSEHQLEPED